MKHLTLTLIVTAVCVMTSAAAAADYRLPFEGRWFVMAGGDTINVNHHMRAPSQWFGCDFMKVGGVSNRAVTKGRAATVEDFYSWGAKVLSPVNGVVRTAHDGEPDNPLGKKDPKNAFGNYVVIEAGETEFVYLAHFQKGTVAVKKGDKVKAGQLLGKCGNSGNTDGPHIHMHVQNQLKPYSGVGKNITFQKINVLLSGKQFEDVDWPLLQGLFVSQATRKVRVEAQENE